MASTKQDQGDPDTQGPINALKSKMELLTLKGVESCHSPLIGYACPSQLTVYSFFPNMF
jgi:hypothetical protein